MTKALEFETTKDLEDWLEIILGDVDEIEFEYNLDRLANTGIDWLEIDEDELLELLRKTAENGGLTFEPDEKATGSVASD
jgi:hypothetical protein